MTNNDLEDVRLFLNQFYDKPLRDMRRDDLIGVIFDLNMIIK